MKKWNQGFCILIASLLAGCSGGLEFNGDGQATSIQPRATPVQHFPLPIETFDPQTQLYVVDTTVVANGRATASPQVAQPSWSEPATIPMPVDPAVFPTKTSTDIWRTSGSENRDFTPPAPTLIDEIDAWGGGTTRAGSMSMVTQWLLQQVDGQVRTDTPIDYDSTTFQSVAISIVGGTPTPPPAPGDQGSAQQSPIDAGVGPKPLPINSPAVIGSNNEHYTNAAVATMTPPTANEVEYAFSFHLTANYEAPPGLFFGKWIEADQENLFIESNRLFMSEAPLPFFYAADATTRVLGGIYIDRSAQDPYYVGVLLGHIVGVGVGLPQLAFIRPGISNGEEDLMNVNVEVDQLFFRTSGRRFQYVSEGLARMQNTRQFPLGSQERIDAEARSAAQWFDALGMRLKETTPGPLR